MARGRGTHAVHAIVILRPDFDARAGVPQHIAPRRRSSTRRKMTSSGYQVEIDQVTDTEWSHALSTFRDANLYQTWSYGEVRWGRRCTSHLILKRNGRVVAMAQVAVFKPLPLRMGIAQLRWGPVCLPKDGSNETDAAAVMADALYEEYVRKRGMYLRILPAGWGHAEDDSALANALDTRFACEPFEAGESYRTMVVDLRPSLESIRKALDQKWRNQLNRAERNGLSVSEPSGESAFRVFAKLYEQMVARKQLVAADLDQFIQMQDRLPNRHAMKVLICEASGEAVAGLVGGAVGNTGIYLLGATNEQGMKSKGAYLLQWHMMAWLKQAGLEFYDLGGINPETNPGVYHFKKGMGGHDVQYPRPRVACSSTVSGMAGSALKLARRLRQQRVLPPKQACA
jgi:Acetyltransferase (GNAT) domain